MSSLVHVNTNKSFFVDLQSLNDPNCPNDNFVWKRLYEEKATFIISLHMKCFHAADTTFTAWI
jgi:predicted nucleic acid-binding protein